LIVRWLAGTMGGMTIRIPRLLPAVAMGLALVACASQGGSPEKTMPEEAGRYDHLNEEQRRALWVACLGREIERLDDMTSGAGTVARAAMELCREQAVPLPADSRGRPLAEYVRRDIERVTAMVLERRAERRRSGQNRRS